VVAPGKAAAIVRQEIAIVQAETAIVPAIATVREDSVAASQVVDAGAVVRARRDRYWPRSTV
jgi:hypothetical protein